MIVTQIQLTKEEAQQLETVALAENISVEELVHRTVQQFLQTHINEVALRERKRRALAVVGKHDSGHEDNSVNHDLHLADIYAGNRL